MFEDLFTLIKKIYAGTPDIQLHEPRFRGNEKKYLSECIDSTFVSSVGPFVTGFEKSLGNFTGASSVVVTCNGTAALHIAMVAAGVIPGTEVITQALTFVATANAITYCGADPIFLDSDPERLSLSATALQNFLEKNCQIRDDGFCYNKKTAKKIVACIPMHVFGHPADLEKILALCRQYNLFLIEDAAESLGSFYKDRHTGLIGDIGVLSFNGNKVITTGGGGAVICKDEKLGARIKHLTTTAKRPHAWEFFHDEVGYNYRLPNINAALGCAQLEQLPGFLADKREIFKMYEGFCIKKGIQILTEPVESKSNFWLNAIFLKDRQERDQFLTESNKTQIRARPVWTLMTELPMYQNKQHDGLKTAKNISDRLVNLPSSVR